MTGQLPYWRLSGFYFFYFASLGTLLPYWGLYLDQRGFSAFQIGTLFAILSATKLVAPYLWGQLADRLGRRMMVIRLGALLAALAFPWVLFADLFWQMLLLIVLFSFFWNAILPQFEAVTFSYLGNNSFQYSRIRLWGSLGFIVAVTLLAQALNYFDLEVIPIAVSLVIVLILVAALYVKEPIKALVVQENSGKELTSKESTDKLLTATAVGDSIQTIIKKPAVMALLAVCFLSQFSHGTYYSFYSLYLEQLGYSKTLIGTMWSAGVVAEVIIFSQMYRLLKRFGPEKLLLAGLLLTTIRWLMIGYTAQSLYLLLAAQLLHAASFGVFHGAAIELIHRHFKGKVQGRGQAIYSSISFGAGVALGSFVAGIGWDYFSPQSVFTFSAIVAFSGTLVCWKWLKPVSAVAAG